MKTYDEAIKQAWSIYLRRDDYCYLFGGKGQVVTDSLVDKLVKQYPDHYKQYSAANIAVIKSYSRGKICFDCSGFTGVLFGDDNYSGAQIQHVMKTTTPTEGVAGSLLWKPGHVGIDVGYGLFLHFPNELHTCEIGQISAYNWEKSGEHWNINYEGSTNK